MTARKRPVGTATGDTLAAIMGDYIEGQKPTDGAQRRPRTCAAYHCPSSSPTMSSIGRMWKGYADRGLAELETILTRA